MTSVPLYQAFLGTWILIPDSCQYEQGAPPKAGSYTIRESAGVLTFTIAWTDAEGEDFQVDFSGPPDGTILPFAGGELADSLRVEAVSPRELNSSAYLAGVEHMVAQRQLDDTGIAMRVIQVVRFSDGNSLKNISVYQKSQ